MNIWYYESWYNDVCISHNFERLCISEKQLLFEFVHVEVFQMKPKTLGNYEVWESKNSWQSTKSYMKLKNIIMILSIHL